MIINIPERLEVVVVGTWESNSRNGYSSGYMGIELDPCTNSSLVFELTGEGGTIGKTGSVASGSCRLAVE